MGEMRVRVPSDLACSKFPIQKQPRVTAKDLTLKEICTTGMVIKDHYVVQKVIGEGSFGKVLKVFGKRTDKFYAMKIIKDTSDVGSDIFLSEQDVLTMIKTMDPKNVSRLVNLKSTFLVGNHSALLFDLYPLSLDDYITKTEKGMPFIDVQIVAFQVLQALSFLKEISLTHGDIKPQNIMICDETTLQIKVIDLGFAFKIGEIPYEKFQTLYYRAPEVIFGMAYDNAVDIWSVACVMVEMRTRMLLFDGNDEVNHLRSVIEVRGMPPNFLLREGSRSETFFEGRKLSQFKEMPELKPKSRSLYKILCAQNTTKEEGFWQYCHGDLRPLMELLGKMLAYERALRIDAQDAMNHPFFSSVKNELQNGGVYHKTT